MGRFGEWTGQELQEMRAVEQIATLIAEIL